MIHNDIRCPYKGGENDFSNAIRVAFNMIGFLLYKKKLYLKTLLIFGSFFLIILGEQKYQNFQNTTKILFSRIYL